SQFEDGHRESGKDFNDVLFDNVLDSPRPRSFYKVIILLLTLILIVIGGYRLLAARHRLEPGVPLLANALVRVAPPGSIMEQRYKSLLQSDNLAEFARTLAQQCFAAVGAASRAAPEASVVRLGSPDLRPPTITVQGG